MKRLFTFIITFFLISVINFAQEASCPTGMQAYWKFDEKSDTTVYQDYFGANDAQSKQGELPYPGDGALNGSLRFDELTNVVVPYNPVFDWKNDESFSFELWMNTGVKADSEIVLINRYEGTAKLSWWLGYNPEGKAGVSVRDNNGIWMEIHGVSNVTDEIWHYIVGVRDAQNGIVYLYVDGKLENQIAKSFSGDFTGKAPINIGAHAKYSRFKGWLDEVAIYNKALTGEEINLHYQNVKNGIDYCGTSVTSVDDEVALADYELFQNYPNPFNPSTTIKFSLPEDSDVTLEIYSLLGERIAVLLDGYRKAGNYNINFDAENLSSGIYLYRLMAGDFLEVKKMQLIK